METIESEEEKVKRLEKSGQSLRDLGDLRDTNAQTNTRIVGLSEREDRRKRAKRIPEEITVEKFGRFDERHKYSKISTDS